MMNQSKPRIDTPLPLPIPSGTAAQEQRRYARREYRHPAVVSLESSLPAFERDGEKSSTFTLDISRGGTSFLSKVELMPRETGILELAALGEKRFAVVRCRRRGENCFEIGARFIAKANLEESAGDAAADQ